MATTVTVDGVEVHVEGGGATSIVMLHGWPDTFRLWDDLVRRLAPDYRCLRLTLPGFEPGSARQARSLDQIVALLEQVVGQLCPGHRVSLLLHDWGCLFGYQFAMRHPELVDRLIGVDVGDAGSPAHQRELPARAKAMIFGYQIWLAAAWRVGGWFGGRLGNRMARAMARWLRCPTDAASIGAGQCYPYDIAWTGSHGGYRRLREVAPQCPMLYVYGRRKPFHFHSKAWAEALAARPGSLVLALPTGHWVMTQQPEAFYNAVRSWLAATG
jgi:pimeloyl-ACP methyl ester carboxylesterase